MHFAKMFRFQKIGNNKSVKFGIERGKRNEKTNDSDLLPVLRTVLHGVCANRIAEHGFVA